ncbi:centriolin-like [Pelmatolapia mariae]|uniref:centriolin-like n=1 Tax=Pelmatolapia mariae TaxID=158779 RepID=UPI002FE6A344
MSRMQSELEGRLDNLLSRIAAETQEIKELEQQLTDGQILANEALQRELEEVISGLQEYLRGLREQAHRSQQQVHTLQAENLSLQLHLEDAQKHCRQLEDLAMSHTQSMSVQQGELFALRMEVQALRERQVQSSRHQAQLEVELQQLREELSQQVPLGQEDVHRLPAQLSGPAEARQEDESRPEASSPVRPNLTLPRCWHQRSGTIQQTRTTTAHKHSREHKSRPQARPEAWLDRDQVEPFEEPEEEVQRSQSRHRLLQNSLLRSQSDAHQRSLGHLNRKLRRLSRSTRNTDQLTVEQLKFTIELLRGLNQLLHTQESVDEQDGDAHWDQDLPSPKAEPSEARRQKLDRVRSRTGTRTGAGAEDGGRWFVHAGLSGGRCVCDHSEAEKKRLQPETRELRHTLRQHRSVMKLCDEVECVEKTLLKRRAELREADRKLLEAQSCIQTSRVQANEAQRDAAALQLRGEDKQRARELQEEVEQLRRMREEKEQMLRQVEEELRSREEELQQLNREIQTARDTLADLLSDCVEAQGRLHSLSTQELQQQQGALLREGKASAVREEEERLVSLKAELGSHRGELKRVLQELLAQQEALKDAKTKRTHTLQQLHRTKDELHRKRDEVEGARDELHELEGVVDRKREELAELTQEVESRRREAESCLREKSRQQTELQNSLTQEVTVDSVEQRNKTIGWVSLLGRSFCQRSAAFSRPEDFIQPHSVSAHSNSKCPSTSLNSKCL